MKATFLAHGLTEPAAVAIDELRKSALAIKRFDGMAGASPSLEELYLPGGFVIGIITVDDGREGGTAS